MTNSLPGAITSRRELQLLTQSVSNLLFNSGALAIKAGGSALAKTVATVYGFIDGVLITEAAQDMPALSGTVTADAFNVFCFYLDSAGAVRSAMGTEGATLSDIVFPAINDDEACIGFVVINPTGTGDFVGGTTALDDATVVPNAAYVNTLVFNPKLSNFGSVTDGATT